MRVLIYAVAIVLASCSGQNEASKLATSDVLPAAQTTSDLLEPARAGEMECYRPDRKRRTCMSMARYRFEGGRIVGESEALLSAAGPIFMYMQAPVEIRGDAICSHLRAAHVEQAEFQISGRPATRAEHNLLVTEYKRLSGDLIGSELCERRVKIQSGYLSEFTADGEPLPDAAMAMIWVKPSDGYRVAAP